MQEVPTRREGELVRTTNAATKIAASVSLKRGKVVRGNIEILAAQKNGNNRGYWLFRGVLFRPETGNIQVIMSDKEKEQKSDASWDCSLQIDNTKGRLNIVVNGGAGQTIIWLVIVDKIQFPL